MMMCDVHISPDFYTTQHGTRLAFEKADLTETYNTLKKCPLSLCTQRMISCLFGHLHSLLPVDCENRV